MMVRKIGLAVLVLAGQVSVLSAQRSYCIHNTPGTFGDAVYYCESNGMTLAIIDSAEENALAAAACGTRMCWLGLREAAGEGTWEWSDGRRLGNEAYANWNVRFHQPGNDGGEEKLAMMNAANVEAYDGTWFDADDFFWPHALCSSDGGAAAVCPQTGLRPGALSCAVPVAAVGHPEGGATRCQERCYPDAGQNLDPWCCAMEDRMSCKAQGGQQYRLLRFDQECASGRGWTAYNFACCPCEAGHAECEAGALNGPGDDPDHDSCTDKKFGHVGLVVGTSVVGIAILSCICCYCRIHHYSQGDNFRNATEMTPQVSASSIVQVVGAQSNMPPPYVSQPYVPFAPVLGTPVDGAPTSSSDPQPYFSTATIYTAGSPGSETGRPGPGLSLQSI